MFYPGDTIEYEGRVALVNYFDPEDEFGLHIDFLDKSSWEWWYGEEWSILMQEWGDQSNFDAAIMYCDATLISQFGQTLTYEDCL
jgi:hypothetical protein